MLKVTRSDCLVELLETAVLRETSIGLVCDGFIKLTGQFTSIEWNTLDCLHIFRGIGADIEVELGDGDYELV